MAEYRTAADFGIVRRPPMWARSMYNPRGLFTPSKEEAEAIRQRKEKERLIAEAQLRQQNAGGLVANALAQEQQGPTLLQQPPAGPTQIQQPIVPGPSRTDQLNQAVLAKIQREGVGSDLPQQQVGAVSTPTAVDLTETEVQTTAPVSNSDRLNQFSDEYLGRVKKRKSLFQGIAGLFGLGGSYADDYEKNALAKYTDYVDNQAAQIALEGGLPATKVELISKHLKAGGSLESAMELVEGVWPAAATKPGSKTHYEMRDGQPMKISSDWSADGWVETGAVPATSAETNIKIEMPGSASQTELAKGFGKSLSRILSDEQQQWAPIQAESAQLPLLIDAIASGQVNTGKAEEWLLPFKQAFAAFLPESEMKRLFTNKLGATEWFKAISDSFVGNKLKMTKGSISEREMAIFQKMIPSLSLTAEGNIRLLNMMHALNRIALNPQTGAIAYSRWADTQEGGVGGRTGNQNFIKLNEFQKEERDRAVRFLDYLSKAPVGVGVPPVPLERSEAFNELRAANSPDVTDKQINDQLDKWGYPSG